MDALRKVALALVLLCAALDAAAATLIVDVRDARGSALNDAVVYAVPEGREVAPAKRTAIMDQRNRTFVPHVLAVQSGTAVRFPNSDDIRHQVYSFSPAKSFQLPLYTGMPSNPVVFNQPGVVTLGCNIHDRMSAYIVVVDTPYFARTTAKAAVTLANLGAGTYVVHVWHPEKQAEPAMLTVSLGASDRKELKFTAR